MFSLDIARALGDPGFASPSRSPEGRGRRSQEISRRGKGLHPRTPSSTRDERLQISRPPVWNQTAKTVICGPISRSLAAPGDCQYHLPRAKPPKATSPMSVITSPSSKLPNNMTTIPTMTMIPPIAISRRFCDQPCAPPSVSDGRQCQSWRDDQSIAASTTLTRATTNPTIQPATSAETRIAPRTTPRATIPAVATRRMRTDSALNRRLSRPGIIVRLRPAWVGRSPAWSAGSPLLARTGSAMVGPTPGGRSRTTPGETRRPPEARCEKTGNG